MTETSLPLQTEAEAPTRTSSTSTFNRVAKYTLVRTFALFVTVVIGVYITVLIANMGGHVDNIRKSSIREQVAVMIGFDDQYRLLTQDQRNELMEQLIAVEERRLGLDQPFMIRSFRYLTNALTLDLGRAHDLLSDSGSRMVRNVILERLPHTLVLFATANLLIFLGGVYAALFLSRRYGSFLDRVTIAAAPTSAAPPWFYGIFLILIFAAVLGILPFGGAIGTPPPTNNWEYLLSLLRHLILPVTAVVISSIFLTIYQWRTFFLIYSSEDYVDMAKAKGLSSGDIERRYVLRPTLPAIITSFAFTLIYMWQGAIITETVFNWPGLGRLYFSAIGAYDTPVIVGLAVIFAYLLA
ncbi:MAG: ABC transporter permease, partial [Anaerolineales bacterium]|nr:ABC transporter permease [Anaerolineales bacterium]